MNKHKNGAKPKISEMVLNMSESFLSRGEDRENRENLLRIACTAWNIACFELSKRPSLINEYIMKFREINSASEEKCRYLREDIEQLIQEKERLYPHVIIRILGSKIELLNGEEQLAITSTPFK